MMTENGLTKNSIDLSTINRTPIVISLIVGAFVSILNETLLNNALPNLMKEFSVSATTIQWLSTGFMLVVGISIPVTAVLQQWFTTRQLFLSSMLIFLIGTLIAAFSPTFGFLLTGRVIQALGTGLNMPIMTTTILIIYPPKKRGGAMGLVGLVITFAPAIGPTLSGIIIDSLNWRWLFYLIAPLALISVLIGAKYLRNVTQLKRSTIDIISIVLSTLGFGGIVYGFSMAGDISWSGRSVYWPLIIGIIGLVLFIFRQLKINNPILDLRTFKYPMFSITIVLIFMVNMSLFSVMTLLPMFLQGVLLASAFVSGLIMLPGSVLNGIMGLISGKLFDKYGPYLLIIPGMILIVIAMWFLIGINASTSIGELIFIHCILLTGLSLVMMPAQTHGLNQLPVNLYPHGSAIFSTLQQVSGAIGTALFISIMSSGQKNYLAHSVHPKSQLEISAALTQGLHEAFLLGLIVTVIVFILSFFIKHSKQNPESNQENG
ncbi:MAG: MDR family MFS transporter [Sporolactobacillus sp.]